MKVGDLVRVRRQYYTEWDGQLAVVTEVARNIAFVKRIHDGVVDWWPYGRLESASDENR